jgi:hypothetical protein
MTEQTMSTESTLLDKVAAALRALHDAPSILDVPVDGAPPASIANAQQQAREVYRNARVILEEYNEFRAPPKGMLARNAKVRVNLGGEALEGVVNRLYVNFEGQQYVAVTCYSPSNPEMKWEQGVPETAVTVLS